MRPLNDERRLEPPKEGRRPRHPVLYTWLLVLAAAVVAGAVMLALVATSTSSTAGLGLFITLPLIWLGLLFLGVVATLVLVLVPRDEQPLGLSVSVVPLIVAVLAVALPELVKHNFPLAADLPLIAASILAIVIGVLLGVGIGRVWRAPAARSALVAGLSSAAAWSLLGGPWVWDRLDAPDRPNCADSRFDEAAWKHPSAATSDPDGDGLTVREELGRGLSYCDVLAGMNRREVRARLGSPDEVRRREWFYVAAAPAGRPDGVGLRRVAVRFRHPSGTADRVRLVPGDDSQD